MEDLKAHLAEKEGLDDLDKIDPAFREEEEFHKLVMLFSANQNSARAYLYKLKGCRLKGYGNPIGLKKAMRMLELAAALASPEHLIALRDALIRYCTIRSAVETGLTNLSLRLFQADRRIDNSSLISAISRRIIRAYFTSLINDGRDLLFNGRDPISVQNGIYKAVKAVVAKMHPAMTECNSSHDPSRKEAFVDTAHVLRKWRLEGVVLSML